jgi:DNA-binding MarR family transcriptional regulator
MNEKLLSKLKQVDHLIIQMIFKNTTLETPNKHPSRTQATILDMLIKSNGELTQKEIEEKLNVSRATISETLCKMEKELGMTKPTITKAIKGLQEKQLVKKENNFHNGIITANTYKINLFKYN